MDCLATGCITLCSHLRGSGTSFWLLLQRMPSLSQKFLSFIGAIVSPDFKPGPEAHLSGGQAEPRQSFRAVCAAAILSWKCLDWSLSMSGVWRWPDLRSALLEGGILASILTLPPSHCLKAVMTVADTDELAFVGQEWWLHKLGIGLRITKAVLQRPIGSDMMKCCSAIHEILFLGRSSWETLTYFFISVAADFSAAVVALPVALPLRDDTIGALPLKLVMLISILDLITAYSSDVCFRPDIIAAFHGMGILRVWPTMLALHDSRLLNVDHLASISHLTAVAVLLTAPTSEKQSPDLSSHWAPHWALSFDALLRFARFASSDAAFLTSNASNRRPDVPCITRMASQTSTIIENIPRFSAVSMDVPPHLLPRHIIKLWAIVTR